jgi:hypothetical protein
MKTGAIRPLVQLELGLYYVRRRRKPQAVKEFKRCLDYFNCITFTSREKREHENGNTTN